MYGRRFQFNDIYAPSLTTIIKSNDEPIPHQLPEQGVDSRVAKNNFDVLELDAGTGTDRQASPCHCRRGLNIVSVLQSTAFMHRANILTGIYSDRLNDNGLRHMFCGNIAISGGEFNMIHNANNNRTDPFELLQRRVAPSAFHNSEIRFDPPRCHPNTRVANLQSIYDWIVQSNDHKQWLLWLNGAAGAGKSAIMQSITERCAQAAIAIASFFFFRGDLRRNTTTHLIATLAYQLIQAIPETSTDILLTIEKNPLIFDQSLESQLQLLLVGPLRRLPSHLQRLFVVLIDGLDECNDPNRQSSLIKLFGTVSSGQNSPIIFLIASRREPQIEGAFVDRQVSQFLRTLALDNSDIEQTSEDIRYFLSARFKDIKETHLHRHLLPWDWPRVSAVEEIVRKSSGQFIYASVVINYISSPRNNPAALFDIVRGLRLPHPPSQNPFAHLDALYRYIFSQVEALDNVLDLLATIFIAEETYIPAIEGAFGLEEGGLAVCFADLSSVIECQPHTERRPIIKFLHTSLSDFLLDKMRSERFYIDVEEVPQNLDPLSQAHSDIVSWQEYTRLVGISRFLAKCPKASDRLQHSFMSFSFVFHKNDFGRSLADAVVGILHCLKQMEFNDQGQAYQHVVGLFAAGFAKYWPYIRGDEKDEARKSSDLVARICQIRGEEV
ncbi:hypothetical protein BJ912DRAFT_1047510 [Pholiota molesta]|nr:hypothetical protein BJ912DRAFT_1047510 [Pholiota molesta]